MTPSRPRRRSAAVLRIMAMAAGALVPAIASAEQVPVRFQSIAVGHSADPTGLFTPEEVAEGGSDVQPSIRYAVFPVDGGEVSLSVLVGEWCGMSECPYRFRLVADNGMSLQSDQPPDYGTICQDSEAVTVDPVALTVTACGAVIDLKAAR